MFQKIFLSITLILAQFSMAFADTAVLYTCPQIERQADQLDWKCLEQASDKLIYKAQLMSQILLEQIEKMEAYLGEQQDVFFIARAGSSMSGFDQLKSHDKKGKRISLDEIFDYGVKQMPNNTIDKFKYEQYQSYSSGIKQDYQTAINVARSNISRKYIDKNRPKLKYSHSGILFRTAEGVWNIYHELMPCNETKKAYLFQDSAMSGTSSFFVDQPHKYIGLIVPLKKELQNRIIKNLNDQEEFMARGPVYRAMSNPWQADTSNSNSFVLEMFEYANMPEAKYDQLSVEYKAAAKKRDAFLDNKRKELGVDRLSVKQMEQIETQDEGYKKVCRPDYKVRKEVVKSYTKNGYEPTKIVFDTTLNFRDGFKNMFKELLESVKVTFIPLVGEHVRPSKVTYAEHIKLGVGEAVSVYSIWKYLERANLIHPKANPNMFETPELNYETAKRLKPVVEGNISLFVDAEKQEAEFLKLDRILDDMRRGK